MLKFKHKHIISSVSITVVLAAFLLQLAVVIPHYMKVAAETAVSGADLTAVAPDGTDGTDNSGEPADGETDGEEGDIPADSQGDAKQQDTVLKRTIPVTAPVRQWADNIFSYETTLGQSVTFQQLFTDLGVTQSPDNIKQVTAVTDTAEQNLNVDTANGKVTPKQLYDTLELFLFTFKDDTSFQVRFSDSAYTPDIDRLCTGVKLIVNGKSYSSDDAGTTLAVSGKKDYDLMIDFSETPELQFANHQKMHYHLPEGFLLSDDFNDSNHTVDIDMGRYGTLSNNRVTYDSATHSISLEWNSQDSNFEKFCTIGSVKFTLVLSGKLDLTKGSLIFEQDKTITLTKENLQNASITKKASYAKSGSLITYDIFVTSDGTTEDLVLTDVMGYALQTAESVELQYHHALDTYDQATFTNPSVTSNEEGRLVISIPQMEDEDQLHISYTCKVDIDKIAQSRHATEEETGNTATIVGDNDPSDNVAKAHVSDIDFSSISKTSKGLTPYVEDNHYYSVIHWQAITNYGAKVNLAGSDFTDIMGEQYASISSYFGDGVTVSCYDSDDVLKETRSLYWSDLNVDPASDKTWTYHIPDDDKKYKYVFDYSTRVLRDRLSEQIVVTNHVNGKCGEADAVELVDPLGDIGVSVSKQATEVLSDHVTWDINLTVEGETNLNNEISLKEGYNSSVNSQIPKLYIKQYTDRDGNVHEARDISERLERLEVYGLQPGEHCRVYYWANSKEPGIYDSDDANCSTRLADGTVIMTGFPQHEGYQQYESYKFTMYFYKDGTKGIKDGIIKYLHPGLNLPDPPETPSDDYVPKRMINVKMTNYFPNEWANAARDYSEDTGTYQYGNYTHTNWIMACGKKKATASFLAQPVNVYKRVLIDGNNTGRNPVYAKDGGPKLTYPVYQFYVAVNGISTDDPIVIEDTFDTSVFQLFDDRYFDAQDKKIAVEKNPNSQNTYVNWLFPTFGGQDEISNTGPKNDNGKAIRIDLDTLKGVSGENNKTVRANILYGTTAAGYRVMESDNLRVEETATGARFTFKNPSAFKKANGQYYNFYMVDYYLVPRDAAALAELERRISANGDKTITVSNKASFRGNTTTAYVHYPHKNKLEPVKKDYAPNAKDKTRLDFIINVNPGKLRLNDGNLMEVRDVYSDSLSVDYRSIRFQVDPPERASLVQYDYHGNVGSFIIPDETNVKITYTAVLLTTTTSTDSDTVENVSFSNKVTVLGYSSEVTDQTDVKVGSYGKAIDPEIFLYKFRSNHMETGLNGAVFELLEDKIDANGEVVLDENGDSVKIPVCSMKGDHAPVVLPTENDPETNKPGYIHVTLSQTQYGMILSFNKNYYLHEKTPPEGYVSNKTYYQFKIMENGTVNYSNREYLNSDVLTVYDTPEYIDVDVSKQILGNVALTAADKAAIHFKLEKWNATENKWEVYNGYSDVKYSDFVAGSADGTVVKTLEHLKEGKYKLTETGNTTVKANHIGSTATVNYVWEDNVGGKQKDSDLSIVFEITQAHLQKADNRTLTLTNTFSIDTVDKKAIKRWYNPDGTQINWPSGLKTTLEIYRYDRSTSELVGLPVQSITLDGVSDDNGEYTAGIASFNDLPRYQADGTTEQIYAVREATVFKGYQPNQAVTVFYDTATNQSLNQVTVKNTKKATTFSVDKAWEPMPADGAYATFRLFACPEGENLSKAAMVKDITVNGTAPDGWTATFDKLPVTNDLDVTLQYFAKEIDCTTSYEPTYELDEDDTVKDYALAGETVTNKPAKTSFQVTVQWENTVGGQWPKGQHVALTLRRRNPQTGEVDVMALPFDMSGVTDSGSAGGYLYTVKGANGSFKLNVDGLPKYSPEGNLWEYFISQAEYDTFTTTYSDKNRADMTSMMRATNSGFIVNTAETLELTVRKTVQGNFGSMLRSFRFTVTLRAGSEPVTGTLSCVRKERNGVENNLHVTFDANGQAEMTLRHGESFTIKGIPSGTSYTVEEEDLSGDGYVVTVTGNPSGTLTDANAEVSFLNSREGSVPTGLSLGITCSAAVLVTAVGAIFLILRKRRKAQLSSQQG